MAKYVDGFVLPIPANRLEDYKKMAKVGAKVWKEYGALDYKEGVLNDGEPEGVVRTFAKLAKPKPGETVIFAYITFKSKAHRDKVNAKVFADPRMNNPKFMNDTMPDMKRMAYGGFEVIAE